jgi:hypothetical protein
LNLLLPRDFADEKQHIPLLKNTKSSMKKTTKTSSSTSAAPVKTIVAASPKAVVPKAPAKKKAATASAAPVKKKSSVQTEVPATFISARCNVGFGNHLYLRGEGPGLSWDHGVAMDCVGSDLWSITLKGASAPVLFKVLVNDLTWSAGNDYVVEPGQSVTVSPTF